MLPHQQPPDSHTSTAPRQTLRLIIFLTILLSFPAFSLLFALLSWRVLRRMRSIPAWLRVLPAAAALLMTGGFAWMVLERMVDLPGSIPRVLLIGVYLWHMLIVPPCLAVFGGFWIARRVRRTGRRSTEPEPERDDAPDMGDFSGPRLTRRQVLACGLASFPAVMIGASAATSIPQLNRFRIRRMVVSFVGLPPLLDGLRIVHLSDTHVGRFTEGRMLDEIARATNELKPDLIGFTGDLLNNTLDDLPASFAMLNQIERQDRLFICEGNHDLFEGHSAFRSRVRDAGFRLLLNESEIVNLRGVPVRVAGICWGQEGERFGSMFREHTNEVNGQVAMDDGFRILLAHHPEAYDVARGTFPLTLAGHTHGGQLMLTRNLGPGPLMFKYWSGLYRNAEDDSALVVSNGVGNWFPLRMNAPAEIVLVTLRRTGLDRDRA